MSDEAFRLDPALFDAVLLRSPERESTMLRGTLLSFLNVLDSLERLMSFAMTAQLRADPGFSHWLNAVSAIQQQLIDVFEDQGVIFFNCVGESFDPTLHEAIETVERHDLPDKTVLNEISRGCTWRGKVLRCARVVVVCNPG